MKRTVLIALFQSDYSDHVFACDIAMKSHLIAKLTVDQQPSAQSVNRLKAAEIGLLDCQDYDLFQKRLLRWGLTETDLGTMRLEAIEAQGQSLKEVVREHEFRY
ncbi:hypothetical protein FF098_004480 [Parvularcula flava]|uniref:Uncharacterized protein n=1 Tax=Aquisalinus luteolus TaxID=1566827 RepID=A0ABX0HLC3_9PROT|nr:TIGR03982 family His-Xaa-Ser system protein [Aquisalinus luteolus]NHK27157.1 hypothetical protein [Aquisalinus luteolus]